MGVGWAPHGGGGPILWRSGSSGAERLQAWAEGGSPHKVYFKNHAGALAAPTFGSARSSPRHHPGRLLDFNDRDGDVALEAQEQMPLLFLSTFDD